MTVREIVLAALAGDEQKALDGLRELLVSSGSGDQDVPRVLDLKAAAAYLGLSEDALDRRARRGTIPSVQEGPRCKRFFSTDALDDWRAESFH